MGNPADSELVVSSQGVAGSAVPPTPGARTLSSVERAGQVFQHPPARWCTWGSRRNLVHVRRCRGDQHRLSGGLKKGPNVPNLWQMLAHQHPLPRAGCNQPRLTGHQARSRKGQPLCLGIKLGYRGPLFQESHTIWGRSRVRDGKSERPEEAEVNLNIK